MKDIVMNAWKKKTPREINSKNNWAIHMGYVC